MSNIFFTSDTHAGHGNIIKWSHRPFLDPELDSELLCRQPEVQEYDALPFSKKEGTTQPEFVSVWKSMPVSYRAVANHDETLIKNWNNIVGKGDVVYHLGDLSLHKNITVASEFLHALNGQIFFIRGNHDSVADKLYSTYPEKFAAYKDYHSFTIKGLATFVCSHYAFHTWDRQHYGSVHCYGHSHGKLLGSDYDRLNRCTDVGVDTNNYTPLSIDDVVRRITDKEL